MQQRRCFLLSRKKIQIGDEGTMLQKEMTEYWSQGSLNYDHIIQCELESFRPKKWQKLILGQAPKKNSLDVLDVGCGPGFFSIILSQAGHRVTGVDCSTGMLEKARQNAEFLGVSPIFLQLDCTELPFPDSSFDLVVSRNVTWTLSDPLAVYREWQRVLNPGGVLLIFDANWNLHYYDESLMEEVQRREKLCIEKYGSTFDGDKPPTVRIDYDLLPLSSIKRPAWDVEQLTKLGFSEVYSVLDITESLWDDKEKLLYGATPMFMVKAIRA
jgi:ubiquinone/menaquinone biosynthesis C-methylase UbiE